MWARMIVASGALPASPANCHGRLVAGVEERRRVELRRFLDQPHDRVVVGGRRHAFLVDLQPLHPEVHDSLLQQGGGARGVRVDAGVGDQTVRVLSAGVVEVAQRVGFEDRRVRVGHHDGPLDADLVE